MKTNKLVMPHRRLPRILVYGFNFLFVFYVVQPNGESERKGMNERWPTKKKQWRIIALIHVWHDGVFQHFGFCGCCPSWFRVRCGWANDYHVLILDILMNLMLIIQCDGMSQKLLERRKMKRTNKTINTTAWMKIPSRFGVLLHCTGVVLLL